VWNDHPKDAEAWKAWVKTRSDALAETLPELRSRLGVKVEPTRIAGVPAFIVTPGEIAPLKGLEGFGLELLDGGELLIGLRRRGGRCILLRLGLGMKRADQQSADGDRRRGAHCHPHSAAEDPSSHR